MKKGFTLIELLVVVAIIGLLASVVVVALGSTRAEARDVKRISDFKQIQTALEIFYDRYNRYPITAGHQYWEGHWMNFEICLETGIGCGFSIAGYEPVMASVPTDPRDPDPEDPDNGGNGSNGISYYYSWAACNDQMYILRAKLETDHSALNSDSDGAYYSPAYPTGCEDSGKFYCIKKDWCH